MQTLGEYVLQHPQVEKEVLFLWMQQILFQLQTMEQLQEVPERITPFHIIIKPNQTIVFETMEEKIPSHSMLKMFAPPTNGNYIYTFGKTVQFLLAKTKPQPALTRREEAKFQKTISKCLSSKSKKQYHSFLEINLNSPKRRKPIIEIALALLLLVQVSLFPIFKDANITEQECFELGIEYFLTSREYEKSEEMFRRVSTKSIGSYYAEMANYMAGESGYSDFEMELVLNEAGKLLEVQQGWKEQACLVRVYEKVDTPNSRKQIEEIVNEMIKEIPYTEIREEMRGILANVYLREGEYENALREYRALYVESRCEEIQKTLREIEKKTR